MNIETQNQTAPTANQTTRNSRITTLGAWMILIGIVLSGFSINEYFKNYKISANENLPSQNIDNIKNSVLPIGGYEIAATWGDIGPKLIESGVIDKEQFLAIYKSSGGLNSEELKILELGSEEKIKITTQNSHFVLNMLWALGLAQQNSLLTTGDITKYEDYKRFASTGGWTIASKPIDEFYSKFNWLDLDSSKEKEVKKIAENVYRPCCNNSTAFPDCNHGMAALGLIEIMIANNNNDTEIYDALKYFNSFWFSSSYLETAIYFQNIKGTDWDKADSKEILSKEYSSSSGWSNNIHKELQKYPNLLPQIEEGGGCGV